MFAQTYENAQISLKKFIKEYSTTTNAKVVILCVLKRDELIKLSYDVVSLQEFLQNSESSVFCLLNPNFSLNEVFLKKQRSPITISQKQYHYKLSNTPLTVAPEKEEQSSAKEVPSKGSRGQKSILSFFASAK